MQWFKHDSDASQDAKLQNVLLDYGLEGYGLYWYCLELIAGGVDKENVTFELEHDARIIARNVGSTAQKVEEMMRYFVEIDLFESCQGKISCLKMAKRLDKSMTSNPEMRILIDKIRGKSHDAIMINHAGNMIKPDLIMQDKIRLEENRVKDLVDSEESPVVQKDYLQTEFDRFWRNYPTKKAKLSAQKAFVKLLKGKTPGKVKFNVDMILSYHTECIEREEIGADKLHAATLLNQKRWEDNPEFIEEFKQEWLKENANG